MNKVVLAYSGGLDTSIIAKWLQETYNCEVVTFTADIGQGEEVEPARAKAEAMGIKEIYIEDRVPINIVEEADNSLGKIYFFTNIRNFSGERITHRWIYQGRVMAEVSFNINGPRWRIWSSKNLWHTWIGEWRVEVLTTDGSVLYEKVFNYVDKE